VKALCGVILPAVVSICLFPRGAAADSETAITSSTVLAEVDGVQLTLADLEKKGAANLFQARNTFHEAHRKAIDEFVDAYLLERQARRESVSVDRLLEIHINSALPKDPSEEALRVYYEGLDTKEPFEAVREKILDAVRQRRVAKARSEYLRALRSEARVAIVLGSPRAPIPLDKSPVLGSRNAPVVMVEYADYECPYCQKIQPVLERLRQEFAGKLAIAYKDVPLPMHSRAQKAAEGARCAGTQGKYWEFHDRLYGSQQLDVIDLKAHARALKLDAEAFDRCLDSGAQAETVKADLAEAQALGLPGTPAFFFNGRFLSPTAALTYETLRQMVEEELAAPTQGSPLRAHTGGGRASSTPARE
jgi:protein-disulfide isomerase